MHSSGRLTCPLKAPLVLLRGLISAVANKKAWPEFAAWQREEEEHRPSTMWPEMKAWASMADDPLKRASSSATSPSSPMRRFSPTTMAVGGLLTVGTVGYFMFMGKDDRQRERDRHNERLAQRT
ncbi:hypothetical protein VPH35_132412 [Triticum aestivum]